MILNLKELSKYVVYTKFKMDHIDKVVQLLHPSDYLMLVDLVQAYGHLWCSESHQKCFQFSWRGKFYCYCTLPQGFSDSPRMFVHVTQPSMANLRRQLVNILIYINDTFLWAQSPDKLMQTMTITQNLFQEAGLTINFEILALNQCNAWNS